MVCGRLRAGPGRAAARRHGRQACPDRPAVRPPSRARAAAIAIARPPAPPPLRPRRSPRRCAVWWSSVACGNGTSTAGLPSSLQFGQGHGPGPAHHQIGPGQGRGHVVDVGHDPHAVGRPPRAGVAPPAPRSSAPVWISRARSSRSRPGVGRRRHRPVQGARPAAAAEDQHAPRRAVGAPASRRRRPPPGRPPAPGCPSPRHRPGGN